MELTTRITDYPETLQAATECIKSSMRTAAQAFVGTGYYLKYVRDKQMYQEAGYIDIWEYGKGEFGLSRTMISRYMSINDRFSQNGNSPILLEEYKGYGYSKLSEMLALTDEEISAAGITETTTIARIREVKKELKEEEPEIPEQIPGQTEITDFLPDAEPEDKNTVATSQKEQDCKLKLLTKFALEYYKQYMDTEQHMLFDKGEDEKFILYTRERLLPFFKEKKDTLCYVLESGRVEISPDGYIKLSDGVVREICELTGTTGNNKEQAADEENVRSSTTQSNPEEKKSDWQQGVFENDNVAYGWERAEMVARLFERLEKQTLEIEDIDGELAVFAGKKRYAFLSEDEEYVEFIEAAKNEEKIDFKISIDRLKEEFEYYKKQTNAINTSAENDSTQATGDQTEEIIEAEVVTEPSGLANAGARDKVIADVQYNGCAGPDTDGESYTCPPRRKPCDTECKWKPSGLTFNESQAICNECWHTYVKELIEKDRNGENTSVEEEKTILVNNNTIKQQPELPKLKNNDQRKEWINNFESWPIWIDNKETQERFYRYIFSNGDMFVIRQAYSKRSHWEHNTRKWEHIPHWGYQKEYIVKKDQKTTLADSESNTSMMIEYLKNLQKKKED